MTRNIHLRGLPGLKLYGCISIHWYYQHTKFHQNRKGLGQLVIDLTWNDPSTNIPPVPVKPFFIPLSLGICHMVPIKMSD